MKTFGYDAVKLSEAYGLSDLAQLREAIVNDPANANPAHAAGTSVYLYTKSAQRKLDALAWAVSYVMAAKRKLEAA